SRDLPRTSRPMMPVLAKQAAREPRRVVHLTGALLGLLAKDPRQLRRVIAGDIGGAFGVKGQVNREDVAIGAAALHLGRSVKWIEDRNEHLMVGGQAREETVELKAAVKSDGTVLALRVGLTMDTGAYSASPVGAPLFSQMVRV